MALSANVLPVTSLMYEHTTYSGHDDPNVNFVCLVTTHAQRLWDFVVVILFFYNEVNSVARLAMIVSNVLMQ